MCKRRRLFWDLSTVPSGTSWPVAMMLSISRSNVDGLWILIVPCDRILFRPNIRLKFRPIIQFGLGNFKLPKLKDSVFGKLWHFRHLRQVLAEFSAKFWPNFRPNFGRISVFRPKIFGFCQNYRIFSFGQISVSVRFLSNFWSSVSVSA